jgi:hypothetical protein
MAQMGRVQVTAAAQEAGNKGTAGAAAGQQDGEQSGERGARSVESRVEVGTSSLPAEVELSYQWKWFSGLS